MRLPDQRERDAIRAELDVNLMVESPAGAGKTQSLCERMVAGIQASRYRVGEMAAVTFTRKAAAEMRGRLQLELERARPCDAIRDALSNLDRMFIGTIHSFCARLLREFPVEAGVSPGFEECDEALDEALRNHQLRRALEEPEGLVLLKRLSESGLKTEELFRVLQVLAENGEVDFPAPEAPEPELEAFWQEVERFSALLQSRLPDPLPLGTTCALQHKGRRLLERCRAANRQRLFSLLQLVQEWEREPKMILKYWAPTRKEQYELKSELMGGCARFRSHAVAPFLEQWRAWLYSSIIPFLAQVRDRTTLERRRRGCLSYNDLLLLSAELLRKHDVSRFPFRWLFVDEFQDTDPVQAEILFRMAAAADQEVEDWSQLALRPGALFIVGDPKQAIYRFRRADIETYSLVRSRMDRTLPLSASFRTLPGLCEWVNGVFSHLLPERGNEKQAAFSPLCSTRQGAGGVALLTQSSQAYQDVACEEAEAIADWILAHREYRWGDFMVLTLRRDDLSHYVQALEARGIPTEVTGGRARSLVLAEALVELLAVLADPYDQVGLIGVLRGPLFGLGDDQLYLHKDKGGAFTWWTGQGDTAVNEALAMIQRMRHQIGNLPLGAAVERILEESGLIALAGSHPGGQAEASELLLVADQIRQLGMQGMTLRDALAEVQLQQSDQPPSLACGPANVVRVMNVHQSKGLEARIVFLASPTGGAALRADRRIVRDPTGCRGYLSLRNRWQTYAQPPEWPEHEAVELEFLAAERVRLLYVAATRARDLLVVGRWSGSHGSAHRPWAAFEPFLGGAEELARSHPARPQTESGQPQTRPALRTDWAEPSWSRTSVLATNEEEASSLRAWAPAMPDALLDAERPDAAAIWGDLIHRLLEHLVRDPSLDSQALERLAHWFLFETPELEEFVPVALETVENLRATDFWRRVMEGARRLVEVPFAVRAGSRYVFGILDLAVKTEEGWELVDYKTGRRPLRKLVASYERQVQAYAEHWASLAEEKVSYAGIFGVREGKLSGDLRPEVLD